MTTQATSTPVAYSTALFRREHEGEWRQFDALVQRLESGSVRRLADEDLIALPRLYRAVLSSLSMARATSLDAALIEYLEGLSLRGYMVLYGVREARSERFLGFFRYSWPNAVRGLWVETLIVAALLFLGVAVSWLLVASDPAWFDVLMPGGTSQGRDPSASVEELRSTIFGAPEHSGLHVFATFLFTHNSQVAMLCYALGFAFGLPTMMLVTYQGLSFGALAAVFAAKGLTVDFLGWIAIHGTTELFAIIIAGAAGLRIGTAFAFPGHRSRLAASAEAGRQTGAVMIGVVLMLLVAGCLEGFGRQMIQSTAIRYTVGGIMLTIWLVYFYVPRRAGLATAK